MAWRATFAFMFLIGIAATAQQTDPLGNTLFFGTGQEIYKFDANYEILGGESSILRDKRFREKTGNRNYFTFDINRPNLRHQLTVGNFPTKFSSFSVNKELFDAIRWQLSIPRARGSATGFLARTTNNSFDSAGRPIEGREITSTGDWFLAGFRAEANLGAWRLQVGELPEFALPLPQVGVSFVNRFFTNYDLARTTNPFKGVVISQPPTDLYIRIRDDSPEDGDGAAVYRMTVLIDGETRFDFQGGNEPPTVLQQPTSSRRSSDLNARVADGDAEIVYRFPLLSPQEIESVRFVLDIANDYLVELSKDGVNYQRELQAEGNVRDGSNRATKRFFYGELTDETTFGIDLQTTLWGFAIESEKTWYSQTKQYPIFNAERDSRSASAWYLDLNRRFGPVFWRGEYTRINPFFDASNFIDDNDNDDPYLDAREPSVPFAGSDKDDRDRDGVKDWEDDFVLWWADPPKFVLGLNRESMDFNNNGVPDNLEDDAVPNYRLDYDEATEGFHTFLSFDMPFARGLSVIPGYYEKGVITSTQRAEGVYGILSYEPERIPGFGRVRARYTIRRAEDSIPDNYIERGRLIEDELALGDYLNNILTVILDYDNIRSLAITTKFKYERNNLFNVDRRVIDAQLIHQIRYDWKVRDDLTIAPAFRNDRVVGFTVPNRPQDEENNVRNAFILTMTHQVADELQLSAGAQYLTWRDFVDDRNNYNRRVAFMEVVLAGEAFGQKIGMIAAVDFASQTFLKPVGGDERSTNIAVSLFLL